MNEPLPKNSTDNLGITDHADGGLRDERLLDAIELLVESELPDADRNQLLSQIDAKPEYWRVLAIAFVEHQSIRRAIKATSIEVLTTSEKSISAVPLRPSNPLRWQQLLMTTTALLLVFALGYWVAIRSTNTEIAVNVIRAKSENALENEVDRTNHAQHSQNTQTRIFPIAQNVVGYVQWREETGTRLFPLFRGDKVDADWLESHPLSLDKKVMESLTQSGWAASPSRRFVSVKLLDGECYTVPVDDVQYRFVGRSVY